MTKPRATVSSSLARVSPFHHKPRMPAVKALPIRARRCRCCPQIPRGDRRTVRSQSDPAQAGRCHCQAFQAGQALQSSVPDPHAVPHRGRIVLEVYKPGFLFWLPGFSGVYIQTGRSELFIEVFQFRSTRRPRKTPSLPAQVSENQGNCLLLQEIGRASCREKV